jgi:ankyrin repeat protein
MTLADLLKEYSKRPDYQALETGCHDVHTKDAFGNPPISVAAVRGRVDEITLLLDAGADINAVGEHGYTALHEAVEQGHYDIVKLLLERGVDKSIENQLGDTAEEHAEIIGEKMIFNLLSA